MPSADASGFIQRYFERFGTVKAFQDKVIGEAEDDGYAETLLGRRRYLPEVASHLFARASGSDAADHQRADPGLGQRHRQDRHDPRGRRS